MSPDQRLREFTWNSKTGAGFYDQVIPGEEDELLCQLAKETATEYTRERWGEKGRYDELIHADHGLRGALVKVKSARPHEEPGCLVVEHADGCIRDFFEDPSDKGKSVEELQERRLKLIQALLGACAAVRQLHDSGWVHRFLVPEHLWYWVDEGGLKVKLAGLRLSCLSASGDVEWGPAEHPALSRRAYELIAEDWQMAAATPGTDVWMLAAVTWEALLGRVPPWEEPEWYTGENLKTSGRQLPPLWDRAAGQQLFGILTQKDPERRFLGDVEEALTRLLGSLDPDNKGAMVRALRQNEDLSGLEGFIKSHEQLGQKGVDSKLLDLARRLYEELKKKTEASVRLLSDDGADARLGLNIRNSPRSVIIQQILSSRTGDTVLHRLARVGSKGDFELARNRWPSAFSTLLPLVNKKGETLLHIAAARHGAEELLDFILKYWPPSGSVPKDNAGRHPVHCAEGPEVWGKMVEYRPEWSREMTKDDETVLHVAAGRGDRPFMGAVKEYFDIAGARDGWDWASLLSRRNRARDLPVHAAIRWARNDQAGERLWEDLKPDRIEAPDAARAFNIAIDRGLVELAGKVVESLAESDSRAFVLQGDGEPVLLALARKGSLGPDLPRRLLTLFNDPSTVLRARDNAGRSVFHVAASAGNLALLQVLLEGDYCDLSSGHLTLNLRDHEGIAPLHDAVSDCPEEALSEVMKFLLERGADPVARDFKAATPFHRLAERMNGVQGTGRPRGGGDGNPLEEARRLLAEWWQKSEHVSEDGFTVLSDWDGYTPSALLHRGRNG